MDEKRINEAVAALLKDNTPQGREALAEMITEFVQPNHIGVNFISMLLNTRALQPGDLLVKKIRKGIDVRTLVPGSIHLASEITVQDRINYVLDGADVKVTFNEWELESGQIGSVEEIRKEMYAYLSDYYLNKVYTLLTSVWTAGNTPSNFTNVGGSITASALEDAIDEINQNSGGVKAVVGTRAAMTPITKFGAFWNDGGTPDSGGQWWGVNSQLEEIVQRGMLGKYYGAPLISLEQSYDNPVDYNELILPNNRILVIGHNVGEFITYGDVKRKQWTDMEPTPPQWFLELYQQFGLIIDRAQGIYVLQVTD